MAKHNEIKPTASFGDLVTVKGYGNRVFTVESFVYEELNERNGITPNIVYDLTCPFSGDFYISEQADVTVVCKEAESTRYLSQIDPPALDAPIDYVKPTYKLQVITPDDVAPKPKRQSKRQKQAEIDGLLDELIGVQTVVDMCGIDAEYEAMIADIQRRLREATK